FRSVLFRSYIVDRVSQVTAAPVFETVDFTAVDFDSIGVTLNHCRYLFALIWVNQKNDFIVTHCQLLVGYQPSGPSGKARSPFFTGCTRQPANLRIKGPRILAERQHRRQTPSVLMFYRSNQPVCQPVTQ